MIYNEDEAVEKYLRVYQLVEKYELTFQNACIRVGIPPRSWISLKRRVAKILAKKEAEKVNDV